MNNRARQVNACLGFLGVILISTTTLGVVRTAPMEKIKENLHKRAKYSGHMDFSYLYTSKYLPNVPHEQEQDAIKVVATDEKYSKLARLIDKCMKKSKWDVDGIAPANMEEMKQFVYDEIPCETMPEKCFEYGGVYYFSGGSYHEEQMFDFSYGFAVRIGTSEVYLWQKEDIVPLLEKTEEWGNLVAKTIENLVPTEMDIFVIGYACRIMQEIEKIDAPGPQTLDDARSFFLQHVESATLPEYCCEVDGVYWFSGGHAEPVFRGFTDGYAIKKGESTIYSWRITDLVVEMKKDVEKVKIAN